MGQLATFADANRWLDKTKVKFENDADAEDELAQATPIVRASIADLYPDDLDTWDVTTPPVVPELIREVTAMLMAAYRYQERYSEETLLQSTFAMSLERRAIAILKGLRDGTLSLADYPDLTNESRLLADDYWPNESTTVGLEDHSFLDLGFTTTDKLRAFSMKKDW